MEAENIEEIDEIENDWSDEDAAEAESMGWIPPERAGKIPEGKKFVKPKEYMERNPLYKKVKKLEESQRQIASQFQKVSESAKNRAEKEYQGIIAKLEAEKVAALDEGDSLRVVDIDKKIRTAEKPINPVDAVDPVFSTWVSENPWYEADPFLKVEADRVAERYLDSGIKGRALLDATHDHLKQLFPDKFGNKERSRPAAVEGATLPGKKTKNLTEKDLLAEEIGVFKTFNEMGIFKKPEDKANYIRQVIEAR